MLGTQKARALHEAFPAIDLHADSLLWARWLGYDLTARHIAHLPRHAFLSCVDVPRLLEGGVGAQFFGLVTIPLAATGCARAANEQIDRLEELASTHPDRIRLARTAADLERARGPVDALLGIEGAHALEGDLDRVGLFAQRNVRYLGLVHFSANQAGRPAVGKGRGDADGLTGWGRDLVRCCEATGVLVDLSHINRRGFFDACALAQAPPIVSHTGVAGAHRHWRNIDDEQLRAVADKGGVVGILFCPTYLGGPGIDSVVAHLLHVLDVAGEDTPALGSDYDGMIVPTRGLEEPSRLPLLTDAMLQAGFAERTIGKILRRNVLRVLSSTDERVTRTGARLRPSISRARCGA
jgi:membrane dipeptidase